MEPWLEAAVAVASRQDAAITWQQLRDAGASEKVIASVARRGWVTRDRPGVYSFAGAPRTWCQRLHIAVLAAGTGSAVSHSCAATLWEFHHLPYLTLEITVPARKRVRLPGLHVHNVEVIDDADVTRHSGLPTTTFERTLVDCSTVLSRFQLSANLDHGLRRKLASLSALRECVERLESGPGRRLSVIRTLLDERPGDYDPGGSRSERRLLDVLVAAGLPAPVQQYRVEVNGKTYFLDYAYPDQRVFIEYYGDIWHGTPSAVHYDSERMTDICGLHWQPLIFTAATPDRVVIEKTATALAGCVTHTPEREGQ
jgi:hypothetical protein